MNKSIIKTCFYDSHHLNVYFNNKLEKYNSLTVSSPNESLLNQELEQWNWIEICQYPALFYLLIVIYWPYDSAMSMSLCHRVKCSTSTPLLCAKATLPVKEDVGSVKQESEGSLLWDSTAKHCLSEQTIGKPLLVRKRSRGQCRRHFTHGENQLFIE